MANDRELVNILSSGEITNIQLGGTTTAFKAVVKSDLDTVDAKVTTNEGNITANTAAIATLTPKVDNLEALSVYEFSRITGSSTTTNSYTRLNSLTLTNAPAGTYEYKMSMTFTYSTTSRSAYFRVSDDGGATWTEIRREAKDSTDIMNESYVFPTVNPSVGDIELVVDFRTESNSDTLTVLASNLIVERKV